jgi:atypical dual specificity phosphatase
VDHVYTIEDGRIGGRPGPTREPWNLAALKRDGWTAIVSFECDRLDPAEIRRAGIEHKMICVEDFTAPTIDQLHEFNEFVDRKLNEGKKVLTHCYAGRGRTGTFLASRLVRRGASVEDAVAEVRKKVVDSQGTLVGTIEPVQLEILHDFAKIVGNCTCS